MIGRVYPDQEARPIARPGFSTPAAPQSPLAKSTPSPGPFVPIPSDFPLIAASLCLVTKRVCFPGASRLDQAMCPVAAGRAQTIDVAFIRAGWLAVAPCGRITC